MTLTLSSRERGCVQVWSPSLISSVYHWLCQFRKNKWNPRNIIDSFSIPPSVTPTTTSTISPSTHANNENEITKNENFAKKFWQNFPLKTFPKFSPGQILCKVSISCFPSGRNSIICDSDLIKNFCQKTLAWKQQISKVSNKTLRKKNREMRGIFRMVWFETNHLTWSSSLIRYIMISKY